MNTTIKRIHESLKQLSLWLVIMVLIILKFLLFFFAGLAPFFAIVNLIKGVGSAWDSLWLIFIAFACIYVSFAIGEILSDSKKYNDFMNKAD